MIGVGSSFAEGTIDENLFEGGKAVCLSFAEFFSLQKRPDIFIIMTDGTIVELASY